MEERTDGGRIAKKMDALNGLQLTTATFQRSLQGILDLVGLMEEFDAKLRNKRGLASVYERVAPRLPSEKRTTFEKLLEATRPLFFSISLGAYGRSATPVESTEETWEEIAVEDLLPDEMPDSIREEVKPLSDMPEGCKVLSAKGRMRVEIDDPQLRLAFYDVLDELELSRLTPGHGEIMQRSMLVTLVSAFEQLVCDLYRTSLSLNPGTLKKADFTFSLDEILGFGAIEDAVEEAISRQVDSFSRKNISEWSKWFENRELGIKIQEVADDWLRVREIIERRNVIVHRGSQVSKQYLRNVDSRFVGDLEEGDILDVDAQYLSEAVDQLLAVGVGLALAYGGKVLGEGLIETLVDDVTSLQYELLKEDRYIPVISLSRSVQRLGIGAGTKLLFQVNAWIASVRSGNSEVVISEVEKWDVSALSDRFKLAKFALSGKFSEAQEMIDNLVHSEGISIHDLVDWPLLSGMREEGLLEKYLTQPSALEWQSST